MLPSEASAVHGPVLAALVFVAAGFAPAACASSSDDASAIGSDAGPGHDGASAEGDAGSARSAPKFLDPSEYDDLVELDPTFPFGVTQRRAADADIVGSHWGRHGGPMVTVGVYGGSGPARPKVTRWDVSGTLTAAAVPTSHAIETASGLPSTFFYGADGMVDLPFGTLSLLSYTGAGTAFPGEALLYDGDLSEVKSRAKVNGFYSGAGLTDGAAEVLVYSGLSALSASASQTSDNGLYVAGICDDALLSGPPCPAARKLFGWEGQSGPVVTDAHGNVFVGASLSNGATSDAVYALSGAEVFAGGATAAHAIVEVDSTGTASLAAVAPEGSESGWVLGLGYDDASPIYAAAYVERDGAVARGEATLAAAIKRKSGVEGISVFTDAEGDLWLAVVRSSKGTHLELRRRAE